MIHIKRFLRKVFLLVLLLAIVFVIVCIYPLIIRTDFQGIQTDSEWMSNIPGSFSLNEINIPGTHNSATEYVQLPFFSKCQGMSIKKQLEAGFRMLDIRLGVEKGTDRERLKLMHGFMTCQTGPSFNAAALYLEDVLGSCYEFLSEHPSETILFFVKHEYGDVSIEHFEQLLYLYIQNNPDIWLLTDRIPTLGEARGKIVLFRRYDDLCNFGYISGIPFIWSDQSGTQNVMKNCEKENNNLFDLFVQDRYEYNVEDKWNAFLNGMNTSVSEIQNGAVSLNYLSTKGSLPLGHPYFFASKLNGYFRNRCEFIKGWVMFDFGEPYLARMVYSRNMMS